MANAVWRGFITFGLLSIPVRLFRAARAERVSLRRLYRAEIPHRATTSRSQLGEDDALAKAVTESAKSRRSSPPEPVLAPVQQVSIRKGSDEVLPEKSIVKGYEYEKDRYVVVEPEELKSIVPKTATEMQIEEFVKLAEVDPVYFETSFYVVPVTWFQGTLRKRLMRCSIGHCR
jgi:DNA end-binding protein Ku